jgi:hypothetical protein
LQRLIEAKMKGVPVKPPAVSTPPPVIDLMAALKRSFGKGGADGEGRRGDQRETREGATRSAPTVIALACVRRSKEEGTTCCRAGHNRKATQEGFLVAALANRRRMALAGLWENWRSPAAEWIVFVVEGPRAKVAQL